jgi:uncharacterized protein with NRDE domain
MHSPHKSGYYGDHSLTRQLLMCLILLAYRIHPDYPLIVAANRDEFYSRPTQAAGFWHDHPDLLAGRDLQAGGTWMGITRQGRLAAITNVREQELPNPALRSRGELTTNFLSGEELPEAYLQQTHQKHQQYAGFNLLVGDIDNLWFYSNRAHSISALKAGIYGISNGGFDEHWPKVAKGKQLLTKALANQPNPKDLFALLRNNEQAPDHQLPETGMGTDIERWLSPLFIHSENYGTRCSTVITLKKNRLLDFFEQSYLANTEKSICRSYRLQLDTP